MRSAPRAACRLFQRLGPLLVCCAILACEDGPADPLALLMTQETQPSLEIAPAVPSLPILATLYGVEDDLSPSVDLWSESWALPPAAAAGARAEAHRRASPVLAQAMGDDEVQDALDGLLRSIASARAHGPALPTALVASLDLAERLATRAVASQTQGRTEEAIELGLGAADALQGVSPGVIARLLVQKAEDAMRRIPERSTYTDQGWHRARRLVLGAREALDDGDLPRAIRRAYYACQVLGVELP